MYYFSNPFKDFWFTLILIWTVCALFMQKGNRTLITLLLIGVAFGAVVRRALQHSCVFLVIFKVCKYIRGFFSCQAGSDLVYVFIGGQLYIFCSTVCTISDYNRPFFLHIHLFKVLSDKLAFIADNVFSVAVLLTGSRRQSCWSTSSGIKAVS